MIFNEFSLKGKVALVTGGGTGLGSGITMGLADMGALIACVYRNNYPTEMQSYVESSGGKFFAIQADVGHQENLTLIIESVVDHYGRLDILVNNAGICPRSSALDYTEEMWDNVIQVNQKSVFFLSQLAAKQFMKQNSKGKIINLASMLSFLGGFNTAAYTASKHAVVGLTKVCASEWAKHNINVNAIAPGWFKTNLSSGLVADPVRYNTVRTRIPQGDWGDPALLKGIAIFLASDASDYVNGVTIPVDGGYLTT